MNNNLFLTELEKLLKKMDYETVLVKNDDPDLGNTLRALVPVDEAGEGERRAWLEEYERKSAGFSVCRLVKSLGPELKTPVTEYHDRLCGVGSGRPLA